MGSTSVKGTILDEHCERNLNQILQTEISREAERNQDLFLQKEIFSLLEKDEFNKSNWYMHSLDERKSILNGLLKEIIHIFDIDIKDQINYYQDNLAYTGKYNHKHKEIEINERCLEGNSSYKIVLTVIHEARHAYQHAVVDERTKYMVSYETIKQWKKNMKPWNYKSMKDREEYATGKEFEDAYLEYASQPIEFDAKSFAGQLTDIQNVIPEYWGSWKSDE